MQFGIPALPVGHPTSGWTRGLETNVRKLRPPVHESRRVLREISETRNSWMRRDVCEGMIPTKRAALVENAITRCYEAHFWRATSLGLVEPGVFEPRLALKY